MKADRITRVNELIRRELGIQLYRIINLTDFDPAAVTFTHAQTSVDLRTCRVLVSIVGTPAQQEHLLGILKRHRTDFQKAIRQNIVLRYTPQLHFVLDHSVADGDHVLQLLQQMEENGEVPAMDDGEGDDESAAGTDDEPVLE